LEGVGIARFGAGDVVRHALVSRIVAAYDSQERSAKPRRGAKTERE
jgi:phosphate starvation-inducible PhoH-like protein